MLRNFLFLFIGLGMIGMLSLGGSYTAPTFDSVNFSLCSGYTAPSLDSINFTLGESDDCVVNTCTYSSGDWEVDCNDNCTINSNTDIGGNNLTLSGVGTFDVLANITNFDKILKPIGCQINIWPSGGLEK